MALTYDRPVSYQSHMFNQHSEYEHNIDIKMEPHSFDYFAKESSCNMFAQGPPMEEFKLKHKPVLGEPASPQLISWTRIHPQHWKRKEVLDWIYFVVEQDIAVNTNIFQLYVDFLARLRSVVCHCFLSGRLTYPEHLDGSKLQGEAYNNFEGEDLCQMDRKQFIKADPYYGSKMYETFRNLINEVSFLEPKDETDIGCLDTFNSVICTEYSEFNRTIARAVTGRPQSASDGACDKDRQNSDLMVYHFDNDIKVNLHGLGVYSISPEIELPFSSNSAYTVLSPKLKDAESFTQPLAPLSPSQLPEFSTLSHDDSSVNRRPYTQQRPSSSSSAYPSVSKCSFTVSRKLNSSSCEHTSFSSTSSGGALRSSVVSPHTQSASLARQALHSSSSLSPCIMDKIDHGYLSEDSCSTGMPSYHQPSMNTIPFTDDMNMGMGHPRVFASAPYHEDTHIPKKKDKKNRNNATKNGNHLWEFVRDLLRDPKTNPKLLKWEDKDHGVFRFVQSEKVAQLWGEKKNNPLMTYEKLSRAMRFCRSAGYFDIVPKTGKFPKKLCFRFGEKAHGWKD